jgi:hypothetical protein
MKSTDLAWQAGIIDGEGCITLTKQIRKGRPSPAFRPMITVSNTDVRICNPFVESWGGKLYKRPDSRTDKNWADSYTWYCPWSSVTTCLKAIIPYLAAKRSQAELLIEFISRNKDFPRYKGSTEGKSRGGSAPLGIEEIKYREGVWNAIRKLNTKGKFSRRGGSHTAP